MKIDKKELKAWNEYIQGCKILVIGDVMTDVYIQGQVNRISPEAPVPVVNVSGRKVCMGGAANVAINLQSMGATPILCGVVGEDDKGYECISILEKHKMPTHGILFVDNRPTTTKTRIIGNKMQIVRVDEENDEAISEEDTLKLYSVIETMILNDNINAIIFEDYDKGVITPLLIEKVICLAHLKSIPITVDPKKRNFLHYKNVSLFKPNLLELSSGLNLNQKKLHVENISQAIEQFMIDNEIQIVMTTMSDKGILVCYKTVKAYTYDWIPAHVRSIADVSGAGDTVISIAVLALIYGFSPLMIAKLSNIAGGLVCESVGVVPLDKRIFYEECLTLLN